MCVFPSKNMVICKRSRNTKIKETKEKKELMMNDGCHIQICYTSGELTHDKNAHITTPYFTNDWIYLCDECENLIKTKYRYCKGDRIQVLRAIKGVK